MTTLTDLRDLSPEEREVVLDVGQIVLDIVGIFEPTPFADLTNAVISMLRSDYLSAAVSSVSIIPYAGDLAKFANIPRYTRSIDRAIALARNSPRLAAALRPLFNRLVSAIDAIPARMIPKTALVPLETLRNKILAFVGKRALKGIDMQADQMLVALMGSSVNVGALPRRNARFLVEFLVRNKVLKEGASLMPSDPAEAKAMKDLIDTFRGTDLHAVEPLSSVRVSAGEKLWQWVDDDAALLSKNATKLMPAQTAGGGIKSVVAGQWFIKPGAGIDHTRLGLSEGGRSLQEFVVTKDVEILVSKSSATVDTWTTSRRMDVVSPRAAAGSNHGEFVSGGGAQLYLPRSWLSVRPSLRPTTGSIPAIKR